MDIIEALEIAISAEKKAQDRYNEYIQITDDPETKALFEHLVAWEADHEQRLIDRLNTLKMMRNIK